MFHKARIKLTAWYLLIIMLISTVFSLAFYNTSTREIQRIIRRIEYDQQRREDTVFFKRSFHKFHSIEELEKSREHLKLALIIINGVIFIFAGGAGYFLAGRTLKPIQEMLDEQSRFITDASHELRTPLTSLRSEIEVHLRDKKLTLSQAKKLLESNLEEVVDLQTLSDRLIELTTYQKSHTALPFTELSLSDILEAALKKVTPLAKSKQIAMQFRPAKIHMLGDSQSLSELFTILLDNAIKYSPRKTTITIKIKKRDHSVEVQITDQGIGIHDEDLPYIFDRFYRANKARSKIETGGYGLGLAIAKTIVEAHKGSLSVKSKLGGGTTFSVCFQLKNLS